MIQQLAKLYFWSMTLIVGILFLTLMIGWWGNISGNVWIPGILFLATLFVKAFVANVATFLIRQAAGIIAMPLPVITYDDATTHKPHPICSCIWGIFNALPRKFSPYVIKMDDN